MADLLYAGEHLSCPNYDSGQRPIIEEEQIKKGEIRQIMPSVNKVVFVIEGKFEYSTGQVHAYTVRRGDIFFLPTNRHLMLRALEDARLLLVRIYDKVRLCDCWSVEELYKIDNEEVESENEQLTATSEESTDSEPFLLKVNSVMEKYLDMLLLCHRAGLRCRYYNEGKLKELMFILRAFYPKEKLRLFFSPALASDARFSQQVLSSYNRYGNLSEMAASMNYSISGFERKFRKVFGCSPYRWMLRQKAQEIWHSVNTEDINLKEIADKFGFSSASSFNDFFVKYFGIPPGQARQNSIKKRK
jgi:AraC-like DNA-binding protein